MVDKTHLFIHIYIVDKQIFGLYLQSSLLNLATNFTKTVSMYQKIERFIFKPLVTVTSFNLTRPIVLIYKI